MVSRADLPKGTGHSPSRHGAGRAFGSAAGSIGAKMGSLGSPGGAVEALLLCDRGSLAEIGGGVVTMLRHGAELKEGCG